MTLTLTSLEPMVLQTLDAGAFSVEFSMPMVADFVGNWLHGIQAWNWTMRYTGLTATVSQNYIDISGDGIVQIVDAWYGPQFSNRVRMIELSAVEGLRNETVSGGQPTFGAMGWRDDANGAPYRTFEFDREFSNADTVNVLHKKSWVVGSSGVIPVPQEWEGMFFQACRAYTRGLYEEDSGTIDQRLALLANSDEMNRLRRVDQAQQYRGGPVRGGGAVGEMYVLPFMRTPRERS